MSVLTDEAYVAAELRIPWGNCDPAAVLSLTKGAFVSIGGGVSPCAMARTARHRSTRTCRERLPERLQRRGSVDVVATGDRCGLHWAKPMNAGSGARPG
jgi:hypothetical protein